MADNILLQVEGLKVAYGGIQAVKGVDFDVRQGELVTLIGANGAGKTTTLKAITGLQPLGVGDVKFLGQSIKGQGAWNLAKQGPGDGAGGPRHLRAHDDHREPADGRLHPQGQGDRGGHREGLRPVSAPQGAAQPARRHDCPAASSRCWRWAAR